jgi:AraC-like DNA-binding protein
MKNANKKKNYKLQELVAKEEQIGNQIITYYDALYIKGKTIKMEISDGIWAIYHDIDSQVEGMHPEETRDVIKIHYCISGRCECLYKKNRIVYIGARDFIASKIRESYDMHHFPFGRYIGYSIEMTGDRLNQLLESMFPNSTIRSELVIDRINQAGPFLMASNNAKIHDIFMNLMQTRGGFEKEWALIKLGELILYLLSDDLSSSDFEGKYFSQELINKIKHIKTCVTSDLEYYMKIDEIATKYGISSKGFTECFKAVYGKTYYAFIKEFRIQKSAEILRSKPCKISEVGMAVGYQNASKFSKAFFDIMGVSPLNYKKNFYTTDLEQNE